MNTSKLFVIAALVLVMVVAACGGGGAATTQPAAGTSPTSETAATTAVEVAQATPEPTAETAPTPATEGNLNLDSVSGGLAQLNSYKSKLYLHFVGKDAQEQAIDNSWTMEEEFITNPPAQRIHWSGSESTAGQPATASGYEVINVGGSSYMITREADGTESCVAMTSSDTASLEQALSADMWGGVSDAQYVNTETVNGVPAKHYVWKEGAFSLFGLGSGKGETWVAVDGGYVVKQRIEATGKGVFMAGSDQEGTTTWEWDVTDANGSFQILPPEGCESAAQDIPVMTDATDKGTYGDMMTYTSATPFADAVTFYKTEMPNAGWQPSGTPTEMEGTAMLEFTKEDRTASVFISYDPDSQKTSVVVTVSKP